MRVLAWLLLAATSSMLIAGPPTARADWLSRLAALGEKTASKASRPGAGALDDAARHLESLPAVARRGALAADVGHEGHWTFVNRAGERFTAATPDELKRAAGVLAPEASGAEARLTLVLTEDAAFLHRARLRDLPRGAELRVAVGNESYRLVRRSDGAAERLFAEVRPRVVVELGERRHFDEAVWQLARPLDKARVRLLALEPGGPQTLTPAPRLEPGSSRALADPIDPYKLPAALRVLKGQTALVSGRLEGELLHFEPASGPVRSLILKDLTQAAQEFDVNLIVLHSAAPRQPGGRNWLWQRVEVAGLDRALEHTNLSDFVNALAAPESRLVVTASEAAAGRVALKAVSVKGSVAEPSPPGIADALADLVAELTGKVVSTAIEASMTSSERVRELDRRIVPGIPSDVQMAYLGGVILGLLGLPVALGWWRRLWPAEQRGEYAGLSGYIAARGVRLAAFVLLFLPLAGAPAALLHVLRQAWSVLTWPPRAWRWLFRRRAGAAG
jgi:hypothetical protein